MTFTFLEDKFWVYRLKKDTEHLKTGTEVTIDSYEVKNGEIVLKLDDIANFDKCHTRSYNYDTFSRNVFDTEFEYDAEATDRYNKFIIEITKVRRKSDISVAKLKKNMAIMRLTAAVATSLTVSYLFITVILSTVSGRVVVSGAYLGLVLILSLLLNIVVVLGEKFFKKLEFTIRKEALINTKKLCDENNINWEDGNSLIREANARESAKLWG